MTGSSQDSSQVVWLNGGFLPIHLAAISPVDRGFLYGDGVFETIRAETGCVLYLAEHLQRLQRSLTELRIEVDFSPDWGGVLRELLERNGLGDAIATVKIIITRGACSGLGLPFASLPTICATAHKYVPPARVVYQRGWRLHVFNEGFSPPLAAHKTLNYLYFLCARQAALDVGADEALIMDPDGKITETSAGSILARTDGGWWTPASPFRLPGITLRAVTELLRDAGNEVRIRSITLNDLFSAQTVWVLNSLMGIMPVSQVGDRPVIAPAREEASRLRDLYFEKGAVPD
jgi:branched-chain amino acid aminotransferase